MIVHIFRKDVRLLYPVALIVAAIHLVRGVLSAMLGAFMEPEELRVLGGVLPYISMLGVIALTALVVHQDPLTDSSEDFLVRPIRRWQLLLAKLLFIALIVLGPVFLADVLEGTMSGFDLGTSLEAAFPDALSQFLMLALPAMALASVSRNLTELLAGTLLLFFAYVAFMLVSVAAGGRDALSGSGIEWIRPASIAALFLVIGALVLPTQYIRRTTRVSRAVIACGGLLTPMLILFIPWAPSFAVQQALNPGNGATPVTITFASSMGGPANAGPLLLPLHVEGIATDELVLVDRSVVRVRNSAGRLLFETTTTRPRLLPTVERLSVPPWLAAHLKNVDTTVEAYYSLSVLRAQPAQVLPAVGGDDTLDGRRCFTRSGSQGDEIEVGCISISKAPSCAAIYLPDDPIATQSPTTAECQPDYSPFRLTLSSRFSTRLNSAIFPADARTLKHSHVVIVPYEAVAHLSRHLTVSSPRLL